MTGFRIVIEHGGTTVTSLVHEDEDIYGVIEAVDYALRGIGFEPKSIHQAFAAHAEPALLDGAGS